MGPVPNYARILCRFTAGGPVLPVALVAGLGASLAYGAIPCGTRDGALREPTANDALFVLEAAVGLPGRCGLCLCDVDSGGSITIRDAVLVLQRATGAGAALECPSCPCTARVRQPDAYDYDIALADFNGDGLGDFASRDGSRQLSVWLARGRGVLERSIVETDIGGWRSRVVAADVDGDGFADIVTNDEAYRDLVLVGGNGDGTFREPEPFLTVSAEDVLFEDLNNDGAVDLVTSGFDPPAIVVRLGDGAGGFGPELTSPTAVALYEIRLGDLNGDSAPDLVGIADYGSAVIVMFGHGDGTFGVPGALATGDDSSAVAIGDFDADGRADIAVADTRDTVIRVYHGTESGGFESPREVPIGGGGYALEAGDLDADGIVDLVVGQRRADIAILHGSGTGLLDARLLAVRDSARRVSLTDVDADGDLDLIALADGVLVMLGHGDGTFAAERTSRASARTTALMLGDVDADGVTDLITAEDPSLSAYAGEGTGAFGWRVLTPLSDRPRSSFASDVDTDGFVDVIIAMWGALSEDGYSLSHVSVLRGNGDGHFDAPDPIAGLLTSSIAHGDVDNDGLVDIAAVVHDPTRIEIFTGDGVGGFQSTHGFEIGNRGGTLFLLDADGDGALDLISLERERESAFLWLGNGDSSFRPPRSLAVELHTTDVVAADFDDDARVDLAFLDESGGRYSFRFGDGHGGFVERPRSPPVYVAAVGASAVADFDGDGATDIAYLSRPDHNPNVAILPGDGRGGFRSPFVFSGRSGPTTYGAIDFAVADIDGSGTLDLLIGHDSGRDNNVTFLSDPGNCLLR